MTEGLPGTNDWFTNDGDNLVVDFEVSGKIWVSSRQLSNFDKICAHKHSDQVWQKSDRTEKADNICE